MYTSDSIYSQGLTLEELETLKSTANKFFSEGKYDRAVIGYGFAIQQVVHSVVPSTKRQNGEQPQKMAQFMKTAAPRFQKFVKIVAILYSNRAQAHLNLNQYLKAFNDADAAAIIDPTMFKAQYRKGVAALEVEKNFDAMQAFKAAVSIDPENEEAKLMLERAEYAVGKR